MAYATVNSCKRALVIGIDEYSDSSSSLTTCVNDAKDLSTALSRVGSNIHDKFNVSHAFNCKHAEFHQALNIFIKTIQKGDVILFYFAGHAEEFNEKNYLLPSNYNYDYSMTEAEYREKYAINAQNILHRITSNWPHVTIFILDCCRTKRTRAIHMNGLSPMNAPPETLIVFSCGPGKGALDDALNNKNSVFAENLLRHIETSNEDIETIFMNVARDVKKQTHGFQLPYRTSCLTEKIFLFTKVPQEEGSALKDQEQKVNDYFTSGQKGDSDRKQKTDAIPKTNRSISNDSDERMSDDEYNENELQQNRYGPLTRSAASLSKLRMTFADSDDDDNTSRSSWAQRDISDYRKNYPHIRSDKNITDNYEFYTNKIASHPDGDTIDNIHKKWFGDYRRLEFHHGYIEWLFPIQEKSLNPSSEPLQKHEIEKIKQDKKALKRILESYKLMLDFYGFELVKEETGEIRRSKDTYKERFKNLNTSSNNYKRITRILKCLGEFDHEYLKFPFIEAILRESITENTVVNCLPSCKDYWLETLRSQAERRAIRQYARELLEYRNKGITPPKTHRAIRPPSTTTTQINNKDDNDNNPNS